MYLFELQFAPDICPGEQTPKGGPHAEVGLKPKLSPRGCATKEEELKSLPEAAQPWIKPPQLAW